MSSTHVDDHHDREEDFHDSWALGVDVEGIDVIKSNESITAPEMRYITKKLGNIAGKSLLDVGCGLGEAGVYFATRGADVTSTDISQQMLAVTSRLARKYNVSVHTHKSIAEDLQLGTRKFDVVYLGNLLHHVDIDQTLSRVAHALKPDGTYVSWDPVAYNPLINIYRLIATQVRTSDEHPLRVRDLRLFKKHFNDVQMRFFWFSTLLIFVLMFLVERKNPNKERFWKVVVDEGEKWSPLYRLLEKLDNLLLRIFPPLGLLCWNVVIIAKEPRNSVG